METREQRLKKADWLKQMRKEMKKTQTQLCEEVGIHYEDQGRYSRMENGFYKMNDDFLSKTETIFFAWNKNRQAELKAEIERIQKMLPIF